MEYFVIAVILIGLIAFITNEQSKDQLKYKLREWGYHMRKGFPDTIERDGVRVERRKKKMEHKYKAIIDCDIDPYSIDDDIQELIRTYNAGYKQSKLIIKKTFFKPNNRDILRFFSHIDTICLYVQE